MGYSYFFYSPIFELLMSLVKAVIVICIVLVSIRLLSASSKKANSSFGNTPSSPKKYKKPDAFDWDRPKFGSVFKIFRRSHDIDCGLDERIFGPKNQHKDLF